MSKLVRNFKNLSPEEQELSDFLVEADIVSDAGSYTVAVNRSGYIEGFEHPDAVREHILRLCYRTRYDEELNMFQLRLDRWDLFKELFEATTGFTVDKVEYETPMFSDPMSKAQRAMIDDYVLQLIITKPNETITDRDCSKGEKKIIKNFTTLLNKDVIPPVILIDDVEIHVEIGRHMKLVNSIKKCFNNSQVIFTTHSPRIINNYEIDKMIDLTSKDELSSVVWRKQLVRVLNRVLYFESDNDRINSISNILNELHYNVNLDKKWAKSVVSDVVFESQNNLIGDVEKI
jgi:predicted ATP-dependent endonuclease of OLD family